MTLSHQKQNAANKLPLYSAALLCRLFEA